MYITGSSFYVSTLLFGSPEKIFVQKKKKEGKEKEKKKRRSEKQRHKRWFTVTNLRCCGLLFSVSASTTYERILESIVLSLWLIFLYSCRMSC